MHRCVFIATVASLSAAAATSAGITSWVGPSSSNWSGSSNWSPLGVPNNVDVVVAPRRGATVTLDVNGLTLPSLTIGASSSVVQSNGLTCTLSALTNDGVFTLNSTGSFTDLRIGLPEVMFEGAGAFDLGTAGTNRVFGAVASNRLVNASNHTIRGGGSLGANSMTLTNLGTIESTVAGKPLTIDAQGTAAVNAGLLVARGGTSLHIEDSTFDNASGTLHADAGGSLRLSASTIVGGILTTDAGGLIVAGPSLSTLADLTNAGSLQVPNGLALQLTGTIVNDGSLHVASTGSFTDLRLGGDVTLTGNGELMLANSVSRIYGANGMRRLTNSATHTIHGNGNIGTNSSLLLTNLGVIEGRAGESLLLDLSPGDNQNDALIVARTGGTVTISDTALDNGDGELHAEDGGTIVLNASTVTGGSLTTAGSGLVVAGPSVATVMNLTNEGSLQVPNARSLDLAGTIVNDGSIAVASSGSFTDLRLASDVTLAGNGEMVFANSVSRIYGANGMRRLTNSATHTIHGNGNIGTNSSLLLTNLGVIEGRAGESLLLDLSSGDNQNDALIVARTGGTVTISDTALDNGDGELRAEDGGTIVLTASTITGGSLTTAGSGLVVAGPSVATVMNLTNEGSLQVPNARSLDLAGTIVNDGSIAVASSGSFTDLRLASDVTLAGNGEMVFANSVSRIYGIGAIRRLTNGPDSVMRGPGSIGVNSNFDLTNEGTIAADAGSMTIDTTSSFVNVGSLVVAGTGSLTIQPSGFENVGSVRVDAGRTLQSNATYLQAGGSTEVQGTLAISGGTFALDGGALGGDGTVIGTVANDAGTVDPSAADDAPVASLSINGAYQQSQSGTLAVTLDVGDNDRVVVSGAATVAGAIAVRFAPGFVPIVGQEFTILTANSVSGYFSCLETPSLGAESITVVFTPTAIKLVVAATPTVPADLDLDGKVDASDLAVLLGSWGTIGCNGELCCPADLNQDAKVDGSDLAIMLGAWS